MRNEIMSKTATPNSSTEHRDPARKDAKRDRKPVRDRFVKVRSGIKAGAVAGQLAVLAR